MAASFNRVMLMGNLTRDPELRFTPQGVAVGEFSLAVNREFSSGEGGERRKETVFIDVTVWRRLAEVCNQYLRKGRLCFVEGRLEQDKWETPDGQKRSKIKVVAQTVQFLGTGPGGPGGGSDGEEYDDRDSGGGPPPERRESDSRPPQGGSGGGGSDRGYGDRRGSASSDRRGAGPAARGPARDDRGGSQQGGGSGPGTPEQYGLDDDIPF